MHGFGKTTTYKYSLFNTILTMNDSHSNIYKNDKLLTLTMKQIYEICLVILIPSMILIVGGVLFGNYTAVAVGFGLIGIAGTILGAEHGATARTLAAMWVVIGIIIVVFLGVEGKIPISFGFK